MGFTLKGGSDGRDIRGEAGVVVVFDKVAQEGRIGAVAGDGFDHVVEVADAAAGGFKGVEELPVAAAIELVMGSRR